MDIRKAFDRVNHYKLYNSLLDVGIPVIIVDILCNWYNKLQYAVRWNGKLSARFTQSLVASDKVVVCHQLCLIFL